MPALAITDHGNMYGAVEFYKACKKENIKPIIGCEVYYATDSRHNKSDRRHLILLSKNETGYHNLIKLVSRAYTEGFYYKPDRLGITAAVSRRINRHDRLHGRGDS